MARDSQRPQTAMEGASSGSQTILTTEHVEPATLRLRGARQTDRHHIQWAEDVVDNEGMGKKSSKVCCIYHKPHEPGDSDSDSSSSDSDDEPDLSRAQRAGDAKKPTRKTKDSGGSKGKGKDRERRPSPNAYERQPRPKNGQTG